MRRHFKAELLVPIFPATVTLHCGDKIADLRRRHDELFGAVEDGWDALCCRGDSGNGSVFGLFFERRALSHKIIAHEVLHLTLWILDHAEVKVSCKDDESAAYLCGYLTEWVYRSIGKFLK